MTTEILTFDEIEDIAFRALSASGTSDGNARSLAVATAETEAQDETLQRRKRAQMSYFGLEDAAVAHEWAEAASARTAELLADGFRLETFYADAGGRGRSERFYAYVILPDGRTPEAFIEQLTGQNGG